MIIASMEEYFSARESQAHLYKDLPLYCKSKDNTFVLYKKEGDVLDTPRLDDKKHPELFIKKSDKDIAVRELFASLNKSLAQQTLSNDLSAIRTTLTLVVKEALDCAEAADTQTFNLIPETIEVLFDGFSQRAELLDTLLKIKTTSSMVTEHTINVLILTFRYGFFHELEEKKVKQLALCALFHDIGISAVDPTILDMDRRLTDKEFEAYTTHTAKGCDLLLKQAGFDPLAATVAQEHHERVDGSGYPFGRTNPCYDSQLIGLIDCYEPLTYRDRIHRKAKKPFDSLQLIKAEVLQGKFRPDIFKDFSTCLTVKI